jgi:LuxR family maltose regulon positive regulatory protein
VSTPLLKTKLYIPPVRPGLVSRPLLAAQLDQGVRPGHKLILVSAPAGFGKTTLVNEWVHQVDAPVAWVSLDKEDNDLVRFLTYLVAAIQAVEPELIVYPCSVLPTGPSRATMLGGVLDPAAQPA